MDFKILVKLALLGSLLALGSACTYQPDTEGDEYKVGQKLEAISSLNSEYGGEASTVVIFDDTTRRIHKFDLQGMQHQEAYTVRSPKQEHTVLFHHRGNYVVDLTTSHITIIDDKGRKQDDPVQFVGTPISASFRPDLGYMIVYDDKQSVAFIKISDEGQVVSTWVSGPVLAPGVSIQSGDMNDRGELILGLSDNSIAVASIEECLEARSWKYRLVQTEMNDIKWIAPIPGEPQQVLVRSASSVTLLNIDSGKTLDNIPFSRYDHRILKYSRTIDPHIILDLNRHSPQVTVAYVADSKIKTQRVMHNGTQFMLSQLDLETDSWTYVTTEITQKYSLFDGLNYVRESRKFNRVGFSTLLAQKLMDLPGNARLQMAPTYMFALYPSELGFAERINTNTEAKAPLKLFNLKYIKK